MHIEMFRHPKWATVYKICPLRFFKMLDFQVVLHTWWSNTKHTVCSTTCTCVCHWETMAENVMARSVLLVPRSRNEMLCAAAAQSWTQKSPSSPAEAAAAHYNIPVDRFFVGRSLSLDATTTRLKEKRRRYSLGFSTAGGAGFHFN